MAHLPSILVWGAIAGTVGMVLRIIEGRSELLGKIIAAVVGVAWTSLTYFVVPVMVFERRSAFAAIGHSGALFRSRWGEAMAGEAGLGLASFVLALLGGLPLALGIYLLSKDMVAPGAGLIGVAVLYWVVLALVSSCLSSIFNLALYRYAVQGQVPAGFTSNLVADHWR